MPTPTNKIKEEDKMQALLDEYNFLGFLQKWMKDELNKSRKRQDEIRIDLDKI